MPKTQACPAPRPCEPEIAQSVAANPLPGRKPSAAFLAALKVVQQAGKTAH